MSTGQVPIPRPDHFLVFSTDPIILFNLSPCKISFQHTGIDSTGTGIAKNLKSPVSQRGLPSYRYKNSEPYREYL